MAGVSRRIRRVAVMAVEGSIDLGQVGCAEVVECSSEMGRDDDRQLLEVYVDRSEDAQIYTA